MTKDLLREMVVQNQFTSHFCFDRVTNENARLRLTDKAASVGFIFRHIGETMNLFAQMVGTPTDVQDTTIGQIDTGERYDVVQSRELIERGYRVLQELVGTTADEGWLNPIATKRFRAVSPARLFAHALYHTSNHAGQISLTLARGK